MENKPEPTTPIRVEVSKPFHRRCKAQAAAAGLSLKGFAISALEEKLARLEAEMK